MEHPIIIEGDAFDWEAGGEAMGRIMVADGEPNMGAAMFADPGVMKCPLCAEFMWNEGLRVRCPHCSHEWDTRMATPEATPTEEGGA